MPSMVTSAFAPLTVTSVGPVGEKNALTNVPGERLEVGSKPPTRPDRVSALERDVSALRAQLAEVWRLAMGLERFLVLVHFKEDEFLGMLGIPLAEINEHAGLLFLHGGAQFLERLQRLLFILHVEFELGDLGDRLAAIRFGGSCQTSEAEGRQSRSSGCAKASSCHQPFACFHGIHLS